MSKTTAKQLTKKPVQAAKTQPAQLAKKDNKVLYGGILTALLTLIAFWPAANNGFVNWDDSGYVVENQLIRHLSWDNIKTLFSIHTFVEGNYHPLSILSYVFEYHFVELAPKTYHVINILFHTGNALLVYWWIRLLTKNVEIAAVTAILFGIHPMHVESVAWVSERKDVMYTFFYLAALISYYKYAAAKLAGTATGTTKYYVIALFLFLLSLLSKGQAVTLSVVLLLTDYYMGRGFKRDSLIEKIPFFVMSFAFGVLAIIAQKSSNAIQDDKLFNFFERILFAGYGTIMYLVKLVVPAKLSCFYPYPFKVGDHFPVEFYICPLIIIAALVFTWWKFRQNKMVMFGVAFFLVTIVLVIQLMGVGSTIMSDRYSYMPYIGIFFMIGCAYSYILQNRKKYATAFTAVLIVFVMIFTVATRARCEVWKTSANLWTDVISKYPLVPVAHNNRGLVYKEENELEKALACYNEALRVDPTYQGSYENRGNIYFLQGKSEAAIADFDKALVMKPKSEVAYNSRGAVYFNLGKYDLALADFNKAIEYKPTYPEAYRNRGNAYSVLGKFDKALEDYNTYIGYDPKLVMAYYWRGIAQFNLGNTDAAISDYSKTLSMQPNLGDVYLKRSQAYQKKGDKPNALQDAQLAQQYGAAVDGAYLQSLK